MTFITGRVAKIAIQSARCSSQDFDDYFSNGNSLCEFILEKKLRHHSLMVVAIVSLLTNLSVFLISMLFVSVHFFIFVVQLEDEGVEDENVDISRCIRLGNMCFQVSENFEESRLCEVTLACLMVLQPQ